MISYYYFTVYAHQLALYRLIHRLHVRLWRLDNYSFINRPFTRWFLVGVENITRKEGQQQNDITSFLSAFNARIS